MHLGSRTLIGTWFENDFETLNTIVFWNWNYPTGFESEPDLELCNRNRFWIQIYHGSARNPTHLHPYTDVLICVHVPGFWYDGFVWFLLITRMRLSRGHYRWREWQRKSSHAVLRTSNQRLPQVHQFLRGAAVLLGGHQEFVAQWRSHHHHLIGNPHFCEFSLYSYF